MTYSEKSIGKLFDKLSKEELIEFLGAYAKGDAKFANAVAVHFRKPEFAEELTKIESVINSALDGASDYRTHDSWGYVNFDVSDIFEEIRLRADQGHIMLAFAELELLYGKLLENFEYQGECEISDEAETCLDIMLELASKTVRVEDKEYIFKHCIELSELEDGKDYGADYEDKLLGIAAKFVTPENRSELENALSRFDSSWREEEFKLIRLEMIRKIEGNTAANAFISENLRFPKIREIAFDKALSHKNFAECERLCAGALSEGKQHYGVSPWLYKLYSVYEMTEDAVKMVETAEDILLCGDLKYYDALKALLQAQSAWDNVYPDLLHKCEQKLSYSQYMEILAKEREYALLLEQVKEHTKQIYLYGKMLAEKYPADICVLFTEQINQEAEAAYGREAYRSVCSCISCFAQAGYRDETIEMIRNFQLKYKRKPAFVDELKKV